MGACGREASWWHRFSRAQHPTYRVIMSKDKQPTEASEKSIAVDDEEKMKLRGSTQIRKIELDGKVNRLWSAIRDIEVRTANDAQRSAMAPRLAELRRKHLTVRSRRERLDLVEDDDKVQREQLGLVGHRGPLAQVDVIGLPVSVLEQCAVVNSISAPLDLKRKCMLAIIDAHDLATGELSNRMTPQKNPRAKRARRLSRGSPLALNN